MLSPLCTLEGRDSILFEERNLLDSRKMAVLSLINLNNKTLDWGVESLGVVRGYNPQFAVIVVHLRWT